MITWAQVVLVAPALSTTATGLQDLILAQVAREVNDGAWGDHADTARTLLAAHKGTKFANAASGSGAGIVGAVVTSESLGPMSRSYGAGADAAAMGEYASTVWGQEFYRLMQSVVGFAAFVA